MPLDLANVSYRDAISGKVDLSSTAVTALRVGSSNFDGRKWLILQNKSNTKVYIMFNESATTAFTNATNAAKVGIKIASGGILALPVSDKITVYGVAHTGAGKRVAVHELA